MKNKDKIPPGFKTSPWGLIPVDWENSLLDNLANRGSGHTPDKAFEEYYNGGIKWVSLADSNRLDQGLISDTKFEISELGIKKSSAVLHSPGTVIMSRDAGVGKSSVLNGPMAVSQHFIAWTCKNNVLNNWFLYYWLQYKKEYFERQAVGSTIKTIGLPLFKKLTIGHPQFKEQTAIANCLSTWDRAIEKTQALLEQKEKRKKWLMYKLLNGKIRLKGFEKEKWKEYKISQIGSIVTGNTPSMAKPVYYGTKYCWATAFDFNGVYIGDTKIKLSEEGRTVARIVPKGSILVTCIASIGKNAIANVDLAFNQQINAIIPNPFFNSEFIYYKIEVSSHKFKEIAGAGAVLIINKKNFENMKLDFPSDKAQIAIANILKASDKEIEKLKTKLDYMKKQKAGLMQVLLTGKKRLKIKN
jgi:type I restriction enzyme S subunit